MPFIHSSILWIGKSNSPTTSNIKEQVNINRILSCLNSPPGNYHALLFTNTKAKAYSLPNQQHNRTQHPKNKRYFMYMYLRSIFIDLLHLEIGTFAIVV